MNEGKDKVQNEPQKDKNVNDTPNECDKRAMMFGIELQ